MGSRAMSLLIDTHVLIWLAEGSAELPRRSVQLLEKRAGEGGLSVSAITFWEVAMLSERGRISLSKRVSDWRRQILSASAISEVPLTGEIGIEAVELPGDLHSDPADRIIVATARTAGLPLATRDSRLLAYGRAGHVDTVGV
jgi:PIN domain nuclease of toxin-antitoxin system